MYCGDDQNAKEVVATLIRDVGFDPLDSVPRTASEASRSKP